MHVTCPAHLILLDLITLTVFVKEYGLWSSPLCNFLHDPSSSLLGQNIFLNTLFSKTLSLCSSPKMRDQVLHPYSTTGKITVLYILIFRFLLWDGKAKDFGLNNSRHSPSTRSFLFRTYICTTYEVHSRNFYLHSCKGMCKTFHRIWVL
jgi:hypothetical protein